MSAAAIALFATQANAAIFTLDSNDGTTWDTTNTFWNGATSTWVNDGTNTANFIGTGNTINLTQNISAQGVAISATGYTLAPGAFTLTVGSVGVSASENATVNSFAINASQAIDASAGKTLSVGAISDAAGGTLTKTGSGTLSLTGSSTFAGLFTISAGTVNMLETMHLVAMRLLFRVALWIFRDSATPSVTLLLILDPLLVQAL